MPNRDALLRMQDACELRYEDLVGEGVPERDAADRTFDALRAALGEIDHTTETDDSRFESKLLTIAAEGSM